MTEVPETRYAESEDVSIAYQVIGDGPLDLVFIPNWAHPIQLMWQQPLYDRFLRRLASFTRLICFDKRGSGASDRGRDPTVAPLEGWMDDIGMVMDAVGSERAAILGFDTGGPLATLFAASAPDRASALVLYGTFADGSRALDDLKEAVVRRFRDAGWGSGSRLERLAPGAAGDRRLRNWWGQFERAGNTPEHAAEVFGLLIESDVRHALPVIHVPTLVVHRTGDRLIRADLAREMAGAIRDANYVELPGDDHLPWLGDSDRLLEEIERFLTGVGPAVESNRVLATVLFTDIVDSTRTEAAIGDHKWRELLDDHDELIRREVERCRGRLVKTTGDGVLATFDGPGRAVRCAQAVKSEVQRLGLHIRAGLHVGEVELRGDDLTGIAVTLARRVCDKGGQGEVLVSRTVTDLVAGSGLEFDDRGEHELKGVPGRWQLYAVKT